MTILRSRAGRRTLRGIAVGFAVAALVAAGTTPATAQGLGTNDRRFVVIPGMAHVSYLSKNRAIFFQAMEEFLRPPLHAL